MSHMKNRGFSLIELMIVVAILGILATVAIPSFISQMAKSEVKRCLDFMEVTKLNVNYDIQAADNSALVISDAGLGGGGDTECDGGLDIVSQDELGNLTITAKVNAVGQDGELILTYIRSGEDGTWARSDNSTATGSGPKKGIVFEIEN